MRQFQTSAVLCVVALASLAGRVTAGVIGGAHGLSGLGEHPLTLSVEGHGGHGHQEHHEEPKPYKFGYGVKDAHHDLDFNQQEQSDGHTVTGHYRVQLPDGRTQVVTYTADWKNGYNANVQYEGEAVHPKVIKSSASLSGWESASAGLSAEHLSSLATAEYAAASGSGGSSYSSGGSHTGSELSVSKWTPSSHP